MDQARLDEIVRLVVQELVAAGVASAKAASTGAASTSSANDPRSPSPSRGSEDSQPAWNNSAASTGSANEPRSPSSSRGSEESRPAWNNSAASTGSASANASANAGASAGLVIDLPDPTAPEQRARAFLEGAEDEEGLAALMSVTPARIGQGRAGPRYRTRPWLLFQADQAVTQDALWRDVNEGLLQRLGLFKVETCVTGGKQEYLLRPDLGRRLSEAAKSLVAQKCVKNPQVQVCVGDGLSAEAIEVNLPQIWPVIQQGCQAAGLSLGTPFFIQHCRVGVMNDIGDLLHPQVLMLLIGERPGLGRAESMSVYLGFRPQGGHTDGERDVICNVYNGGTNPLEAGAYAVQMAQKMMRLQASGVKLKLMES